MTCPNGGKVLLYIHVHVHYNDYIIILSPCHFVCIVSIGVIWPTLGMPKILRYISYVLPTTYAAEAMRSIMERGQLAPILP